MIKPPVIVRPPVPGIRPAVGLPRSKPMASGPNAYSPSGNRYGIWLPVRSGWVGKIWAMPGVGIKMRPDKSKVTYLYSRAPIALFDAWIKSPSKGRFWWQSISRYGPAEQL